MDGPDPGALPRPPRLGADELIEDLEAVVWEMDADSGRFTFVSRFAEVLLGYPVERWLDEPDFWLGRVVHPDDRAWAGPFCRSASDANRDHRFEYRAVARDGRVLWLRDVVRVVAGPDGAKLLRGVMFDITEKKAAEAIVRESERRFRSLIENISDIVAVVDAAGRLRYVSPSMARVLGHPADEVLGRSPLDLVHPDDAALLEGLLASRASAAGDPMGELRFRHRDGSWRVLQIQGRGHEIPGEKAGLVLTARDVTARNEAEGELRRQRAYFARLFESAPEAVVLLDEDSRVLRLNEEFTRLFGYSSSEAVGRSIDELVVPEGDGHRPSDEVPASRRAGIETVRRTKDGTLIPVSLLAVPVQVEDGTVELYGIYRDLSAWKRAERALEESEGHVRRLLEGVRAIIWECDAETWAFSYISSGAEEILGYPVEQWYADRDLWARTIHPEDRARAVRACEDGIRACRDSVVEYRAVAQDGRVLWLRDIIHIVLAPDGKAERLRGVMIDITEEKSLEEQLRQAQKMEAVGRLAGGVAHDFNNVLTAIQGHAQLILEQLHAGDPAREDAEEVLRSAARAAGLTRQLLAFSRRQILKPEPVDLNAIVGAMERMLRRLVGEEIALETALQRDLGRVLADPGQIEQVVMNLVVNAKDAMPGGGRLTLATRNGELGEDYTSGFAYPVEPGHYVVLSVEDSGTGMSQALKERIFEPFFTTKAQGKGTGLGLSTVYGIVRQSGGHVWVYSEEGQGSTFKIFLPRMESVRPGEEAVRQRPLRELASGSERILVVEDEEAVRTLVCRVLRRQGYRVLEASDGEAALRLAESDPEPIHLVIADVVMPQMGGAELAERLHGSRPGLPFLFMSGYTEDELLRRGVADREAVLLEKPFSPGMLARKIREALAAKR